MWDLTLRIQGLSLRLRGSSARGIGAEVQAEAGAHAQVEVGASAGSVQPSPEVLRSGARQVSPEVGSRPGSPSALSVAGSFSVVSEPVPAAAPVTPPRQPSAQSVPEYPLQGSRGSPSFAARQRLALSFPRVPDTCIALCRGLSTCELGPEGRAERAWIAGCWAGATLRGEVNKPDPTAPLSQQNRFYCILRAAGLQSPVVCASVAAYRRILGLDLGQSVSHAFPSTSECRVYFSAAQVSYPSQLTR